MKLRQPCWVTRTKAFVSSGKLTLFSCKFFKKKFCCIVIQHGCHVTWLQTKSSNSWKDYNNISTFTFVVVCRLQFDGLFHVTTFMVFNNLSSLESSSKLHPQQLRSPYRKETASFAVGGKIQLSMGVTSNISG